MQTLNDLNKKPETVNKESVQAEEEKAISSGKRDYLEKKEAEKKMRRVASMVQKSEIAIAALEQEIEQIRVQLSDPALYSDQLAQKHSELEVTLLKEMHNWEQLLAEQETLSQI